MTRILKTIVLPAILCLLAAGCQTYVNIPAQSADAANHDPNGKTVRDVMIVALRAALEDGGITGPVQVMLPAKTNNLTYAHVVNTLGDQAVSPYEEDVAGVEGVVFAKGVRIRGTDGEVDVVRPAGEGHDQLVTVYMTWNTIGGWRADRVHVWRGAAIDQ